MAYFDRAMKPSHHIGRRVRSSQVHPAADVFPRIVVSGNADTASAANIVTGGKTIILTLKNAQWVPSGTAFNAVRQAIINGLVSRQSEAHGWNIEVQAKAAVTTVVRTSATVVTVTLPATAGYVITANETIDIIVPPQAVAYQRNGRVKCTPIGITT